MTNPEEQKHPETPTEDPSIEEVQNRTNSEVVVTTTSNAPKDIQNSGVFEEERKTAEPGNRYEMFQMEDGQVRVLDHHWFVEDHFGIVPLFALLDFAFESNIPDTMSFTATPRKPVEPGDILTRSIDDENGKIDIHAQGKGLCLSINIDNSETYQEEVPPTRVFFPVSAENLTQLHMLYSMNDAVLERHMGERWRETYEVSAADSNLPHTGNARMVNGNTMQWRRRAVIRKREGNDGEIIQEEQEHLFCGFGKGEITVPETGWGGIIIEDGKVPPELIMEAASQMAGVLPKEILGDCVTQFLSNQMAFARGVQQKVRIGDRLRVHAYINLKKRGSPIWILLRNEEGEVVFCSKSNVIRLPKKL